MMSVAKLVVMVIGLMEMKDDGDEDLNKLLAAQFAKPCRESCEVGVGPIS